MSMRVGIVDDHPVVVKGIGDILVHNGFQIMWVAYGMMEALENLNPETELMITDIQLPDGDGMQLCKLAIEKYPELRVLAFSSYNEGSFVRNMLRNGASGYLLKESGEALLLEALGKIRDGNRFIDPAIEQAILKNELGLDGGKADLTRRELEILKLLARGASSRQIADELFLSVKTVEVHRSNLFLKLDARNAAHLISIAFEKGLI